MLVLGQRHLRLQALHWEAIRLPIMLEEYLQSRLNKQLGVFVDKQKSFQKF